MAEVRVDVAGLYKMLDKQRERTGLSWRQVAAAVGCSPSTLSRMAAGGKPDVDTFMSLMCWLRRPAETVSVGWVDQSEGMSKRIEAQTQIGILDDDPLDTAMAAVYEAKKTLEEQYFAAVSRSMEETTRELSAHLPDGMRFEWTKDRA